MASILAGYISGSTVDLARVIEQKGSGIRLVGRQTYQCAEFPNFDAILKLYVRRSKAEFSVACFGVAGPVIKDAVETTNLAWRIAADDLKRDFGFRKVRLVNDLVATAHGLSSLQPSHFFTINKGDNLPTGNLALISAGTGLGEALIYSDGDRLIPVASEGGHADFSPGNQLEVELYQYLYSELDQVEVEDVVSLRGLQNIFNFLVDTQGGKRGTWVDKTDDLPGAIIEKALAGRDRTASQTLDIFIGCYASEAANLALKGMSLGGLYVGGNIAPRIMTAMDSDRFMRRFAKSGKIGNLLAATPVNVIIYEQTALKGAAAIGMNL